MILVLLVFLSIAEMVLNFLYVYRYWKEMYSIDFVKFCLKNIGKVDAVVIKFIKTLVQMEHYFNIFW